MATNEIQQQLLRDMGYGGAFGAGGANAWLSADPSRQKMFNERTSARDQGYTGPFGGGAYANWQNGGTTYDRGGVAPVGMVEPFNDYQKQGITMLATPYASPFDAPTLQNYNAATSYAPGAFQTAGMATPAIQSGQKAFTDQDFSSGIARYMTPYEDQVIDRTVSRINEQGNIVRNRLMAKAPGSRSFGTTSDGVQLAELDKNLLGQVGDTTANLRYSGFNNAANQTLSQFNADRGRDFTAAGAYGNNAGIQFGGITGLGDLARAGYQGTATTTGSNRDNATNMIAAGGAIQNQNQRLLDAVRGEYDKSKNYDNAQLTDLARFLASFNSSSSTGQQAGGYNTLGKIGGIGLTALGIGQQQNQSNLGNSMPWLPQTYIG